MAAIIEKDGKETYHPDPLNKFAALALVQSQRERIDSLNSEISKSRSDAEANINAAYKGALNANQLRQTARDGFNNAVNQKFGPILNRMISNEKIIQYKADEFGLAQDQALKAEQIAKQETQTKLDETQKKLTEATAGKKTFLQQYGVFVLGGVALLLVMRK